MTGPEQHADTVREGLEAAEGADFDAGRKDAEQVFKARLTSLDALVALAERADTLERERDAAVEALHDAGTILEGLSLASVQGWMDLATEARAEADRLREALRVATRGCNGTWHCGAVFHVHGCHSDHGLCDEPHEHAALAGPQTKEQT